MESNENTVKEAVSLNRILRKARDVAYISIGPFDALFRKINRLEKYPPINLRRHVSPLGTFDGVGAEFVAYLKFLLQLKDSDKLLDIGCGCGLLELALETAGWRGPVVGIDLHKPSIDWAHNTLSKRIPNFKFIHADIYNAAYWPSGRQSASQWFSDFKEKDFDIAVMKSLFTHMLPGELDVYFSQVSSRLRVGGKALLTFFILNEKQRELKSKNIISFVHPEGKSFYAVRNLTAPSAAVAYEESYLMDQLAKHGLQLHHEIQFGAWTGRADALSHQDVVLVTKSPE